MERPDQPGGWLPPTPPGQAPGAPPGQPPPPPAQPGQQPGAQYGQQPPVPPAADPGNDAAVWGFGLGTTGLVLLWVSNGWLFLPALPFAIAGWVVSKNARDKIKRGETAKGRAWADTGYAVGIGTTILAAIGVVVATLILAID